MAADIDLGSMYGSGYLSPEQIEALNQMIIENTGVDMNTGAEILAGASVVLNIISLIIFITFSVGLYKLSKKLGDKHSWLAFVPLVQFYTLIRTAGMGFWNGFVGILLRALLASLLMVIIIMGAGYLAVFLLQGGSNYSLFIILGVFLYAGLYFIGSYIVYFFLYKRIADRTGQNNTTALLMTFFPFIMLWVVANRIEAHSPMNRDYAGQVENNIIQKNEKIDL